MDDVGNDGLRSAIKNMSIGDIKLKEEDEQEDDPSTLIRAIPTSSTTNDQVQAHNVEDMNDQSQQATTSSTPSQVSVAHPKVHHTIAKDHHINQIVCDLSKSVQTHSCIASFCEHYSFISSIEPNYIEEPLNDPD